MNAHQLLSDLKEEIIRSVKAKDATKAETLRFLLSAVRNLAIDKYGAKGEESVTDEDVLSVVKKQVKTHKESILAFTKGNREDLAAKENAELAILSKYLPADLSDGDLAHIIDEVVKTNPGLAFGPLMGKVMAKTGGMADGSRVSAVLRAKLA